MPNKYLSEHGEHDNWNHSFSIGDTFSKQWFLQYCRVVKLKNHFKPRSPNFVCIKISRRCHSQNSDPKKIDAISSVQWVVDILGLEKVWGVVDLALNQAAKPWFHSPIFRSPWFHHLWRIVSEHVFRGTNLQPRESSKECFPSKNLTIISVESSDAEFRGLTQKNTRNII